MQFFDRKKAGEELGKLLKKKWKKDVVVFALPRGGVVTAAAVASVLHAPLRIVISRKIGHPMEPEYAIAAISEHGHLIHDTNEVHKVSHVWLAQEIIRQQDEICRRQKVYDRDLHDSLKGKIAIIVDDGVATGLTIRAAIADIQDEHPKKIIVATPVSFSTVVSQLKKEIDDVVVLESPTNFFGGVSMYYQNFPQVSDEEIITLLSRQA
ncbi:MAG: phosphoribosyltransferase [Candidatus Levyibacteriota bacterium]